MAIEFDGANDNIDFTDITYLDGLENASCYMWVNNDTLTGDMAYFSKWGASTNGTIIFFMDDVAGGSTDVYRAIWKDSSNNSADDITSSSGASTSQWDCLVSTYVEEQEIGTILYVNGTAQNNGPQSTVGHTGLNNSSVSLETGEDEGSRDWNGAGAWGAFWSIVLDANNRTALFNGANPFVVRNDVLLGLMPMWDTSSSFDIKNLNIGTISNATQATRGPPVEPIENFL